MTICLQGAGGRPFCIYMTATIPAPATAINDMQNDFALADTVWPGAATEPCLCEVDGYGFTERLLGALKTPSAKAVPAVIGM